MRPPIPAGCFDAQTAAEALGTTNREILTVLRRAGLIHSKGASRNLPNWRGRGAGLTQQPGTYVPKGTQVVVNYAVLIIKPQALDLIQRLLNKDQAAQISA